MPYLREDQCDIRVTIAGTPYGDSWKSIEGANLTADSSKTRPGGMGREVSVGGPASRDDCTAKIQFSDVVAGWHKRLESLVGNARAKVSYTFLDANRAPIGETFSVKGILTAVSIPDFDSMSSDVGLYTIVVECDEEAA